MIFESVADRFDSLARQRGQHTAVREKDRSISYAELLLASESISASLKSVCREPGCRVGLMIPNSAAFAAAFFGIARVGGVVAPLNVRYRSQELAYYLDDTHAVTLLVAPETLPAVEEALGEVRSPPAVVVVEPVGTPRLLHESGAGRDHAPVSSGDASAPLLHQYTSGSTGAPKRVIRSHKNLLDELERLALAFELGPGDRFLGAAPFTHVNGLVRTLLTSMFVGGTLHPVPEFRRRDILDLLSRERITYFGAVPYMFAVLAQTSSRREIDLSSLRVAFSASAPLPPEDNRRFEERYGHWVRQLYGSTETGTISVNLGEDIRDTLETVGRPLKDVRVDVVDDRLQEVPQGREGQLVISSPYAITAYDGNDDATMASFREGAYLSGDLGYKDAGGNVTLTGRLKFLINRGGYKVNPQEVEAAIGTHPKVREVVVLGAPGLHGNEVVRSVIVAAAPCTAEEIVEHCRERIADFKIPSHIEFADALPKSETGKILRRKL